jgi:hypothetical protein
MLFLLKFKFDPEHAHRVVEMWKHFTFPKEVKVIGRYVLIGKHASVAILEAADEESLLKITGPFAGLGVAHIHPAMPMEEALKVHW